MDQEAEPNPYVTPRADQAPPAAAEAAVDHRRDGELLLVRNGTVLPPRCILTNQPLEPGDWTGQARLQWTPPRVWLLLIIPLAIWGLGASDFADIGMCVLLGLGIVLLIAVLAFITSKKMAFTYHLNRATREHLTRRKRLGFSIAVLGGIATLISVLVLDQPYAKHGSTVGSLILVAGLTVLGKTTLLTLRSYEDGWFALEGCSEEFLDSL